MGSPLGRSDKQQTPKESTEVVSGARATQVGL
jgi:hypothetical protein